jgi:hypothetical protein
MVSRAGRQAEVPEGYQPPAEKVAELRRRGMSDEEIASRTERFILDRRAKGILYARVDLGWWNWMTDRFVSTRGANARTGSPATARSAATPTVDMSSFRGRALSEREANPGLLWHRVSAYLARRYDGAADAITATWQLSPDGDAMDVAVPDESHIDTIREVWGGRIRNALAAFGHPNAEIHLVVLEVKP